MSEDQSLLYFYSHRESNKRTYRVVDIWCLVVVQKTKTIKECPGESLVSSLASFPLPWEKRVRLL